MKDSIANPLTQYARFSRDVSNRLQAGREAYGDKSFAADPLTLVGELKQEALDLAGWGYVLYCRLEDIEKALSARAYREALEETYVAVPAEAGENIRSGSGPLPKPHSP